MLRNGPVATVTAFVEEVLAGDLAEQDVIRLLRDETQGVGVNNGPSASAWTKAGDQSAGSKDFRKLIMRSSLSAEAMKQILS